MPIIAVDECGFCRGLKKNSFRGTGVWLTQLGRVARPVVFIIMVNWRLKDTGAQPRKKWSAGRHACEKSCFSQLF